VAAYFEDREKSEQRWSEKCRGINETSGKNSGDNRDVLAVSVLELKYWSAQYILSSLDVCLLLFKLKYWSTQYILSRCLYVGHVVW